MTAKNTTTVEQVKTQVEAIETKAGKIRFLRANTDWSEYRIAKYLDISPQHVNNTLKRGLKKPQ